MVPSTLQPVLSPCYPMLSTSSVCLQGQINYGAFDPAPGASVTRCLAPGAWSKAPINYGEHKVHMELHNRNKICLTYRVVDKKFISYKLDDPN